MWLCKRRSFRNKGATLVLIWHFSAFLVFSHSFSGTLKVQLGLLASMLLYPIGGWLADSYFGRYFVIKYSMWIMWSSSIAENIWSLIKPHIHNQVLKFIIESVCKGTSFVGLAGFQSNAIQFSVDQLVDASSSEISSYVSWHSWVIFLSKCIEVLTQVCLCSWFNKSLTYFIFPLFFTLSLVSDILLNKWLIKEPVTQNPLKLIYRVLRYAVKHKYPRLRSAFTYWEDKPYLRIDLAKSKYGGPFSTEEVENVKSFIRIFLLAAAGSVFVGVLSGLYYANKKLQLNFHDRTFKYNCTANSNPATFINHCFLRAVFGTASIFFLLVFVPFFELILYPIITNCACSSGHCILHRFLLGIFLAFLYSLSVISLEIAATYDSFKRNHTICLLYASKESLLHQDGVRLDYKWLMLPQVFIGLSFYLLYTSGMEFVYAQTPYGMRGVVVGVVFFASSLSIALFHGYIELVKEVSYVSNFIKETCGLWYLCSIATFIIFCLLVGFMIKKKYTLRRRDDDTHNEQIFAVEYFDKYIDQ